MNNKDALFSNDDIYDTLIGVFNISTDKQQALNDLSSPEYLLDESDAYTLNGDLLYTERTNYGYQQKTNMNKLLRSEQLLRALPHRVNTIGKLKDIWFDGFRSFETDIFVNENSSSVLEIGSFPDGMSGITLEKFITTVDFSEVEKIWLDFHNLKKENHTQVLDYLNQINEKLRFKDKVILVSDVTDEMFWKF